jgi:hypothetical protein
LLLDVGQLAAGFFEEQLADNEVHQGEQIEEKQAGEDGDVSPVLLQEQRSIRDQEGTFLKQQEADGDEEDRGRKENVGNHDAPRGYWKA